MYLSLTGPRVIDDGLTQPSIAGVAVGSGDPDADWVGVGVGDLIGSGEPVEGAFGCVVGDREAVPADVGVGNVPGK